MLALNTGLSGRHFRITSTGFVATANTSLYTLLTPVFVSPGDVVAIHGGSANFFCSTSPLNSDVVTSTQWLLNDTLLEDSDIDNVQTLAGTIQLRFSPVSLDYNTTRIRCRETLTSGNIITSDEVMLLIQGLIKATKLVYYDFTYVTHVHA